MKKKFISILVCTFLIAAVFPTNVSADMGPKPSVVVDFKGLSRFRFYVTLLTSESFSDPIHSTQESEYDKDSEDYLVFKKFCEYQDADGYYFPQYFKNCSETNRFEWGYRPPEKFKILIYFVDQDCFAVSDKAYERYAFDSYFSVRFKETEIAAITGQDSLSFHATKSYNYFGEVLSFIARTALTVAVELLIALLFGFREKKQIRVILIVNVVTQLLLNVTLNIINFNSGLMALLFAYFFLELLVLVIESVVYADTLPDCCEVVVSKGRTVAYAFTANVASFVVGVILAVWIPVIF